jgi:hypothetical protein
MVKCGTLRGRSEEHNSNHTLVMVPYLGAYMTLSKESFANASI